MHTVRRSSIGSSISACLRKTLPEHARQSIRSKAGNISRKTTPATNLKFGKIYHYTSQLVRSGASDNIHERTIVTRGPHMRQNYYFNDTTARQTRQCQTLD